MRYRRLGGSSLEASEIGFGCWEVGGEYGAFDKAEFVAAVQLALDLGVNMFDTAWGYGFGASEALLGEALGSRRGEAILCTKIGIYKRPDGTYYRDSSRATLLDTVDRSLRALGTDHVELLLVHWPDRERGFEEPMATLQEVVAAGKARHVGVSNFHAADLRACAALAPIAVNQVGYNLFDRRWEQEMFPTARGLGVSIMAYGPLAHGLLAGEVRAGTSFADSDWRRRGVVFGQPLFEGENLSRNAEVVAGLAELAGDLSISLPQLALAWVLRSPEVGTALTGVRRRSELAENVAACEVDLDPAAVERLEQVMAAAVGLRSELPN